MLDSIAHALEVGQPFEARLSVSPTRPPCHAAVTTAARRVACGSPAAVPLAIRAAAAARLRDGIDAEALHAVALLDLVWGDTAGNALDRSISQLATAARLATRPAPILADLSAAYLVRAERRGSARDLLEALEVAANAVELSPDDATARFNLALALDRSGIVEQAAEAWAWVAAHDPRPEWAREGTVRGAALHARLAPDGLPAAATPATATTFAVTWPQEARSIGWTDELGRWGAAVLRDDTTAATRFLALADALGNGLQTHGRDATLADAVRSIRAHAGDAYAVGILADAHVAYARGAERYAAADYPAADHAFEQARTIGASEPVLRAWAELFLGATRIYRRRPAEGERMLRDVIAGADTVRHPALAARARWMLGVLLLRRGQHDAGLATIREAERLFARAGEVEHQGFMHAIEAEAMLEVGDVASARAPLLDALAALRSYPHGRWRYDALHAGVRLASRDGLLRAALHLQDEQLRVAAQLEQPLFLAEGALSRARLLAAQQETDDGMRRALASARRLIDALPRGEARTFLEADVALVTADAALSVEPASAAAAFDSAAAFFDQIDNAPRLLAAVLGRTRAALALDDTAAAAIAADRAFGLLDGRRHAIASAQLRAALLERARTTLDALVMRAVSHGDTARALAYLERGRESLRPMAVTRGQRTMWRVQGAPGAPDERVADYALVGDTLLVWVVRGDTATLTRRTVSRQRLVQTIERARAALELQTGEAALQRDLSSLYDVLVRPIATMLGPPVAPLAIVADGELGDVPFAALYDARRSRYLVEDHVLRFAATSYDATRASAVARGSSAAKGTVLVVADPAVDRRAFPQLPPLPGTERELQALATLYDAPTVLAGDHADRAALLAALPRASLLHYAGHALFDDERPERSALVLAPGPDGDRLTAEELAGLDLARLSIVVLAACETLRARDGRSGGLAGFASALLAAGAGGVVGSLWDVDDARTAPLMLALHRAYRTSGDGPAALRAAQLHLLRSPDPALRSPATWGAFRYAGR